LQLELGSLSGFFFVLFNSLPALLLLPNVAAMSDLHVYLVAPNGLKFKQPLGLFIDNEWRPSSNGAGILTINPA
jgi:hypothetical protein